MNGSVLLSVSPTPAEGIVGEANEFRIDARFPVPNSCCICLEKFDGKETRVFEALPELCRNHRPLIWLTDAASPENVATDLFAAFLRDPTFRCFRRVCTDCFEKSLLARLNNSNAFVAAREEAETDITLLIKCPICSVDANASLMSQNNTAQPTIWWQTTFGDNERLQADPFREALFGQVRPPAEERRDGISVTKLYQHVSAPLWQRISDAVNREYERRHRRLLYCPVNGCEHFQDMEQREDEKRAVPPIVQCAQHGKFCSLCWEPLASVTAAAACSSSTSGNDDDDNNANDDDDVNEDDVFGILEDCARFPRENASVSAPHLCKGMPECVADAVDPDDQKIRRCPHCFAAIERNAGCDQMFCTTCSRSFSWDDDALRCSAVARSLSDNAENLTQATTSEGENRANLWFSWTPPPPVNNTTPSAVNNTRNAYVVRHGFLLRH